MNFEETQFSPWCGDCKKTQDSYLESVSSVSFCAIGGSPVISLSISFLTYKVVTIIN